MDACCAVPGNDCNSDDCTDRASSSDWLFGLGPGPPQRFEPTGTDTLSRYQNAWADQWPHWGSSDLDIGGSGAPGGTHGSCGRQGNTYRGTGGEICGGDRNWGATDVEVWYPR
eukprot:COSAG04_NODE_3909_length_2431_cov_2.493139_1_plen_113_part_00